MRIGIDIDGVFTDIEKWQFEYGSKFFLENYNKSIVDSKGYEVDEIFSATKEEYDRFWASIIFEYVKSPARNFAPEVISKLRKENNEIYIVTARNGNFPYTDLTDEKMQEIIKNWLNNNKIEYDKLIFSPEDKLDICVQNNIDLMIEDKPANIYKVSKKIPVICFNAVYNQECIGENIIRCYSWYDIYCKIKSRNIIKLS